MDEHPLRDGEGWFGAVLSSALLFGEMKERVVGLYGLQLEWC